jgi:hypothetical protein
MRVVGSLTTMPDKYPKLFNTLRSLLDQTYQLDAIYLTIPKYCRRLGIEYPEVPEAIRDLCTVVTYDDYGPITKIIGGIINESHGDTIIITFDDDMIYPKNMVEALMARHRQYPNSALGSSGMLLNQNCPLCAITPNEDNFLYNLAKFRVPPEGRRVDSIYGYPGALYLRRFFPPKKLLVKNFLSYALCTTETYMNDDIIISGYLSKYGIERRIFSDMPRVGFVLDPITGTRLRNSSEISYNLEKFFLRMNSAISYSKRQGLYPQTEPVKMSETLMGVSLIIVIAILLLIIVVAYIIASPRAARSPDFFWTTALGSY